MAKRLLPKIPVHADDGELVGFREIKILETTWTRIDADANGVLEPGDPPGFVLVTDGSPRKVRVLTDELGIFMAFAKGLKD